METLMFESGKIYVVVAVVLVIFVGILFYLIRMDKKLSGMEKEKEAEALNRKQA